MAAVDKSAVTRVAAEGLLLSSRGKKGGVEEGVFGCFMQMCKRDKKGGVEEGVTHKKGHFQQIIATINLKNM